MSGEVNFLQCQLNELSRSYRDSSWIKQNNIEKKLNFYLDKEEQIWKRRCRALWLQHGDRNTKYFHYKASRRRKRNEIQG